MNIVVDKQPKCTATVRVEIPAETVSSTRKSICDKFVRFAKIQGYRPGKAPKAIVESRYKKEISSELEETLVKMGFDKVFADPTLKIINASEPANISTSEADVFSFDSTLILAPEFTLPEYKGIAVTTPVKTVPQEDVDSQLKALQERLADFNTVEGRPVAMGDFAVIDYSSTVNGQPSDEFAGKSTGFISGRNDFWVRVDEETFLPTFNAQIVGMSPGDTREVKVTIPTDFPMEALREQEVVFSVTLKEIKESILPELNEEFAQKLIPGGTLEGLKEVITTNLQEERNNRINDFIVNQIIEHFNTVECELPEEIVKHESQAQASARIQEKFQKGAQGDVDFEQILNEANESAVKNVRANFILQEIASAEKITVTDQEMVSHLVQLATSRKVSPKRFIRDLQRAGRLPSVRQSLLVGKTVDFLVESAQVTESAEVSLTNA